MPIDRFKVLVKGKDKAGEFYRKSAGMFAYVSNRTEISDELYKIDDAMKAGFDGKMVLRNLGCYRC
jgi:3-hydroxyacyl-CoA dehydrogenase